MTDRIASAASALLPVRCEGAHEFGYIEMMLRTAEVPAGTSARRENYWNGTFVSTCSIPKARFRAPSSCRGVPIEGKRKGKIAVIATLIRDGVKSGIGDNLFVPIRELANSPW